MRLIDILVAELPKRGGWINGNYQCAQDKNGEVCFFTNGTIRVNPFGVWVTPSESPAMHDGVSLVVMKLADDWAETIITREQYEAALSAAQQLVWDDDGFPPVGCECEISHLTEWSKARINYISADNVVFSVLYIDGGKEELCWATRECSFRPLHSEADKKCDEAASSIQELFDSYTEDVGNDELSRFGDRLVQRIAAGKIPGVKLDD